MRNPKKTGTLSVLTGNIQVNLKTKKDGNVYYREYNL